MDRTIAEVLESSCVWWRVSRNLVTFSKIGEVFENVGKSGMLFSNFG